MRSWLLATLCIATGCQAIPEDHLLLEKGRQSLGHLQSALDPTPRLTAAARRLPRLAATAESLAPWGADESRRLGRLTGPRLKQWWSDTTRAPARAAATAKALATRNLRSFAQLWQEDSSLRRMISPGQAAARTRHAAGNLPAVLGLDRQPLPSTTDLNRQTGSKPAARRESWVERIARRLPF